MEALPAGVHRQCRGNRRPGLDFNPLCAKVSSVRFRECLATSSAGKSSPSKNSSDSSSEETPKVQNTTLLLEEVPPGPVVSLGGTLFFWAKFREPPSASPDQSAFGRWWGFLPFFGSHGMGVSRSGTGPIRDFAGKMSSQRSAPRGPRPACS